MHTRTLDWLLKTLIPYGYNTITEGLTIVISADHYNKVAVVLGKRSAPSSSFFGGHIVTH